MIELHTNEMKRCTNATMAAAIRVGTAAASVDDFPAAHSMDTVWFAVDADGHIAEFDTGEQGWLPAWWQFPRREVAELVQEFGELHETDGYLVSDFVTHDLLSELARAVGWRLLASEKGDDSAHLHGEEQAVYGDCPRGTEVDPNSLPKGSTALAEFEFWRWRTQRSSIARLLIAVPPDVTLGGEQLTYGGKFNLYRLEDISLNQYLDLHESQVCLGCYHSQYQRTNALHRLGIFRYASSDLASRPYVRFASPQRPLEVTSLPIHLQQFFQMVQFPRLRFLDSREVFDQAQNLSLGRYESSCWRFEPESNSVRLNASEKDSQLLAKHRREYRSINEHLKRFAIERGFTIEPIDDYPAAHSGDVEWFAVDGEGHVAYFNPWKSAPVPTSFQAQIHEWLPYVKSSKSVDNLASLVTEVLRNERVCRRRSPRLFDLEGAFSFVAAFHNDYYGRNSICAKNFRDQRVQEARRENLGPATVIVTSLATLEHALHQRDVELMPQRPEPPPFVVRFMNLSRALAEKMLRSGDCLACFSDQWWQDEDEEHSLPGIFCYADSDPEDGICGPYYRITAPVAPLSIDQIPNELRKLMNQVRFDELSFMNSPLLQPWDHVPCVCHWESFVGIDGQTVRSAPGKVANNLSEHQQRWAAEVAVIEQRRRENLQAMVSDWPGVSVPLAVPTNFSPQNWRERLQQQISEFRQSAVFEMGRRIVRIEFEFSSESVALDVMAAVWSGSKPFLRARRLIFLDWEINQTNYSRNEFANDTAWEWINDRIGARELVEPVVMLGQPQIRPSGAEWAAIWEELAGLRERQATVMSGDVRRKKELRRQASKSPDTVWEMLIALLLSGIGPDFDFFTQYYCLLNDEDFRHPPLMRLGFLVDMLQRTTLDDFAILERIAAFYPLTDFNGHDVSPVQFLRLKSLSLLSQHSLLGTEEIQAALICIIDAREEHMDGLALMSKVLKLPDLPLECLMLPIRRILVEHQQEQVDWIEETEDRYQVLSILRQFT